MVSDGWRVMRVPVSERDLFLSRRGTDGSNPFPSRRESCELSVPERQPVPVPSTGPCRDAARRLVAQRNVPPAFVEFMTRSPARLSTILGPAMFDGSVVHIADVATGEGYRRHAIAGPNFSTHRRTVS